MLVAHLVYASVGTLVSWVGDRKTAHIPGWDYARRGELVNREA